jgi:hypothetical protein
VLLGRQLVGLATLRGIVSNFKSSAMIRRPPLFDLVQRTKTTQAGEIIA